jgi:RND superfamily putative drug exporter
VSRGAEAVAAGLLARLARGVLRRRTLVLVLTAVGAVACLLAGWGVSKSLSQSGMTVPGSQYVQAERLMSARFRTGDPTLILVAASSGSIDAPAARAAGLRLTALARRVPGAEQVRSYWLGSPALRSADGHYALVLVRADSGADGSESDTMPPGLTGAFGPLRVSAGGPTPVGDDITQRVSADLRRQELWTAPITFLVLVFVFGGPVAAGMPVLAGLVAMVAGTALLRLLAVATDVSVFALDITAALGFALTVDYSLFLVARYREERTRTGDVDAAVLAAVRTAGRTVLYSALTVGCSLATLTVFPLGMLRSVAYGGVLITALSAFLVLTALPALLSVLGSRIDLLTPRLPRLSRRTAPLKVTMEQRPGGWHRLAVRVSRRPLLVAVPLCLLLAALILPFTQARFGALDERSLPASAPSRTATETLRREFDIHELTPLIVVLPGLDAQRDAAALDGYAQRLARLPHVLRVDTATGTYPHGATSMDARRTAEPGYAAGRTAWASVATDVDPYGADSLAVVRAVRAVPAPVPALVGGQAAWLADVKQTVGRDLVPVLGLIAVVMLALVGWCTRSPVLALKALLLNILSLSAAFGAMVFVFQQGHLRGLLGGFPVLGFTDTLTPVLVLCVAFGLSMDYEVLLLTRISEEYRSRRHTRAAVAWGLEHTGKLFTASCLVVITVMSGLAASDLLLLKMVGFSLALAALIDAVLIRALLVPALMSLLGRANWWRPRLTSRPATTAE